MSSEMLLHALLSLLLGAPAAPEPSVELGAPGESTLARVPAAPEGATSSAAKVFLTVEEALELAFPKAEVEREVVYLSEEDEQRVGRLARVEYEGRIARPYRATRDGELVGTAYFDTHRVRTLRETLMIVVTPDERVARIEVLAFGEPEEFIPRGTWYGQFLNRALDDDLQLGRGIRNVTGATLTARATTDAARRALALHQVLRELEEDPPNGGTREPAQ